jgi:hypothetical protein
MKAKTSAHQKARSDRELELLLRRASEYLGMRRRRVLKKVSPVQRRPASAA